MTRVQIAVIVSLLSSSLATAQTSDVVRLDPALDALVAPDAKIELVKGGFGFTASFGVSGTAELALRLTLTREHYLQRTASPSRQNLRE